MPNSNAPTVDHRLVRELKNREDANFRDARPNSAALLQRGRQVMPNGVPMAWHVGSYHHLPLWAAEGHASRLLRSFAQRPQFSRYFVGLLTGRYQGIPR